VIAAIFLASLAGSVHCLAMCGPLVGLAGGVRTLPLAAWHALGRLVTYVALGAGAAALGRAIDLAGRLVAAQRVAMIASGVAIVAMGVHGFVARGARAGSTGGRAFRGGLVRITSKRAATRAAAIGALTGLLPCGWLWAFVVVAGGTADPLRGGLVMAAFWLGTVPAMTGLLALVGPLVERVRSRAPIVASVALIALGLGTLALRWHDAGTAAPCPRCADVDVP
jgi:sulfite exporter TauE/SafE